MTARLAFEDIHHAFRAPGAAATPVLDGISFDLQPGRFTAVIGPSGCGTSTLLQMASGLLAPGPAACCATAPLAGGPGEG